MSPKQKRAIVADSVLADCDSVSPELLALCPLYWQAFTFGTADFGAFKRNAVILKAVSVAAFAFVYLRVPLDPTSLAVIAGGIFLNARAAAVLGFDRTYYGHEVGGLPLRRVTAFPYSLTAHPMILGNVAAFGGTLLNAGFREQWWPLASLHVAANIGLLVMELAGAARRRPGCNKERP